ncbi:MAG TPA: zinc-ribbon domain-containing protein [Gemmatimonadaceae bacterium]
MNVSCPQCSTVFRVDPAKVPEGGVRARCSTCGGVIPVGIGQTAQHETPADAMTAAFAERRPQPGPFVPSGRRPTPAAPRPVTPIATPRMTPPASPRVPTPPQPFGAQLPPRPTPRAAAPAIRTPAPQPRVPTPPASQQAISVPPVTPPAAPAAPTPPAPRPVLETPQAPAPAPMQAMTPSTPPLPSPAGASPAPASGRRPINPFLARDPSLRAKRLARALVSDMVAYYPAKHAEGLEKGTLKELFRDEIKKSYEEYVAQVGADFARSTTHFQESLNEVLGAGRKIF